MFLYCGFGFSSLINIETAQRTTNDTNIETNTEKKYEEKPMANASCSDFTNNETF